MKYLLLLLNICFCMAAIAQDLTGYITGGKAYINHQVSNGDGLESIAATYSVAPAALLEINGLKPGAVLVQDQTIKIPVATIIKPACPGDNCPRIYYHVQASEGLYRIGKNYGDIKVARLKQLNGLHNESVSLGQRLLVGYLVLAEGKLPSVEKTTKQQSPPDVTDKPAAAKTPNEPTSPAPVIRDSTLPAPIPSFFEEQYKPVGKREIFVASTFKSESGWADGKYYVLVNRIPVGTILRIENDHGGMIYAKVLGELPVVKNADKISLRISSAGAAALQMINDEIVDLTVTY